MARRKQPEPVGIDEVKDAVLATLAERFDGRMLTWQVEGKNRAVLFLSRNTHATLPWGVARMG